jgi:methylmalonyl-CoA/ethylmalonyl-CoA epimerase
MLEKIHHLGYAVEDIEAASKFYEQNFGALPGEPEVVEEQGIVATMFRVGESSIELVQPTRAIEHAERAAPRIDRGVRPCRRT